MDKLINYLFNNNRRLISPIGGSPEKPLEEIINITSMQKEVLTAQRMAHQSSELGHDIQFTCMNDVSICKAFGLKTFKIQDGSEHVLDRQVSSSEDIASLRKINPLTAPISQENILPIRYFKDISAKLIGGGCFGPLTTAASMLGVDKLNLKCISDPQFVEDLLVVITDFMIKMAQKCQKEGAEFFWIAEPLAIMLSPHQFTTFSGKYIKMIFDSISIPGFIHVCGDTTLLLENLLETGAQCLSLDADVNLRDTAHLVPKDVVIMGNINPVYVCKSSTYEVEREVYKINMEMKNFPNFIMSTGCLLPQTTPSKNIDAIFNITNSFSVYTKEQYDNIYSLWNLLVRNPLDDIILWLSNNSISNEILLVSVEEACTYICRQHKYKKLYLGEALIILNKIKKLLNKQSLDINNQFTVDNKVLPLSLIKGDFEQKILSQ